MGMGSCGPSINARLPMTTLHEGLRQGRLGLGGVFDSG